MLLSPADVFEEGQLQEGFVCPVTGFVDVIFGWDVENVKYLVDLIQMTEQAVGIPLLFFPRFVFHQFEVPESCFHLLLPGGDFFPSAEILQEDEKVACGTYALQAQFF